MQVMRRLWFILLAALVLLAAASLIGVARPEAARGDSTQTDLVTTMGHGVVTAVPDEATVSAGVRTDGATAAAALEANSKTMNAVVAALKQAGGDDLQTQQVSLFPQTNEQGKVTGYSAQNTVSAKSDVAGAGALVDAAVGAGANTVDGPSLTLSDEDALYRQALERAVENARAKALALAHAGGFGVGPITTVVEQGATAQPVYDSAVALAKGTSTPVEPGKRDVTADVTVSFTIHELMWNGVLAGMLQTKRIGRAGRVAGLRVADRPAARRNACTQRQTQGSFAARTDAAGGPFALGDVHGQRFLARAPQRSRVVQCAGHDGCPFLARVSRGVKGARRRQRGERKRRLAGVDERDEVRLGHTELHGDRQRGGHLFKYACGVKGRGHEAPRP